MDNQYTNKTEDDKPMSVTCTGIYEVVSGIILRCCCEKRFLVNETFIYGKSSNKESEIVIASGSSDVPKVSSVNNYRWIPDMDFKYDCIIYFLISSNVVVRIIYILSISLFKTFNDEVTNIQFPRLINENMIYQ